MRRPAIFMDRDGTLSEEVGYVNHLDRYRLLPHSLEAVRLINGAGFLAIVTTNQSGVARGYFSDALVQEVHTRLRDWMREGGARLDAIYYCPHHPVEGRPPLRSACDCRKPRPGMILRAAREHEIDLGRSYAIGDSRVDIEAAAGAGIPGVLVLTGYGRGIVEHQRHTLKTSPLEIRDNLLEAVRFILDRERGRTPPDAASPERP